MQQRRGAAGNMSRISPPYQPLTDPAPDAAAPRDGPMAPEAPRGIASGRDLWPHTTTQVVILVLLVITALGAVVNAIYFGLGIPFLKDISHNVNSCGSCCNNGLGLGGQASAAAAFGVGQLAPAPLGPAAARLLNIALGSGILDDPRNALGANMTATLESLSLAGTPEQCVAFPGEGPCGAAPASFLAPTEQFAALSAQPFGPAGGCLTGPSTFTVGVNCTCMVSTIQRPGSNVVRLVLCSLS